MFLIWSSFHRFPLVFIVCVFFGSATQRTLILACVFLFPVQSPALLVLFSFLTYACNKAVDFEFKFCDHESAYWVLFPACPHTAMTPTLNLGFHPGHSTLDHLFIFSRLCKGMWVCPMRTWRSSCTKGHCQSPQNMCTVKVGRCFPPAVRGWFPLSAVNHTCSKLKLNSSTVNLCYWFCL